MFCCLRLIHTIRHGPSRSGNGTYRHRHDKSKIDSHYTARSGNDTGLLAKNLLTVCRYVSVLICQCESVHDRKQTQQKMDQEKLIETVKSYESLYVISHPKYSDTVSKDNIWRGIAKEMKQPGKINNLFYFIKIY